MTERQRRKSLRKSTRVLILDRDKYTCQLCGRSAPDAKLHVDHIIPVIAGGTDGLDNLRTLCVDCNLGKSDLNLSSIGSHEVATLPEPPWFDITCSATGQAWHRFSPFWTIRQVRGEDPGVVQWRYRSYSNLDDWRTMRTEHFGRTQLSTEIDFSKGATRSDVRVDAMQLGLELRCRTRQGWRHELHIWPLTRTEHPSNSFAPIHMEQQPEQDWPAIWYELIEHAP